MQINIKNYFSKIYDFQEYIYNINVIYLMLVVNVLDHKEESMNNIIKKK